MLRDCESVCIVPGYGMAVAQAAGVVAEIAEHLTKEGKKVLTISRNPLSWSILEI